MLRKLKKLRQMSHDEISTRVREKLQVRRERRRLSRVKPPSCSNRPAPVDGTEFLVGASRLLPGVHSDQLAALREYNPDFYTSLAQQTHQRCSQLHAGHWKLFSRAFDLSGSVDWDADPAGAYRWKREFYADLPLFDDLPYGVDVKYVWELGRHQFLAELALDWLLHRNEKSAEFAIQLIESWIESAPAYQGIHWTSALELSMRAISWAWMLAAMHEYPGWRQTSLAAIAASLHDHGEYLSHHLSYYSSPYNHLIGEAAGLWLIAQLCPSGDSRSKWSATARQVLLDYGPKQFHSDGFSVEQASSYHAYTLSFLAMVQSTANSINVSGLGNLSDVIQKACAFARALEQPDGRLPMLGDADTARVCPVLPEDYWDFRALFSWVASAFKLQPNNFMNSLESYFWLGATALPQQEQVVSSRLTTKQVFPESGYMIRKGEKDFLMFDIGPIAAGLFSDATPSTAHGHADQLQVIAWNSHGPITQDPGMPHYGGDPTWTKFARSTAAHSTLEIEGYGPVRPGGRLEWSHHASQPRAIAFTIDGIDFMIAEAIWSRVRVLRQIAVLPTGDIWIVDSIESDVAIDAMIHWQMCSASAVVQAWDSRGSLQPEDSATIDSDPAGWIFPGYGERCQAMRRTLRLPRAKSHLVVTSLGCESGLGLRWNDRNIYCNSEFADPDANLAPDKCSWSFGKQERDSRIVRLVLPRRISRLELLDLNSSLPIQFWSRA